MNRLYRSRSNRKIAGVLGGLSDYLNADPSLVRVLFFIFLIVTGFMPLGLIYLVSMFIIPNEEDVAQ